MTDELTRGPRIADARDLAKATGAPYAIVLVGDGDGAVLLASWGDDAKACRFAEKRMLALAKALDGSSGIDRVGSIAAEEPGDDGEASGDDD